MDSDEANESENARKKRNERLGIYFLVIPGLLSIVLGGLGVPYAIYFIPCVLVVGFVVAGLCAMVDGIGLLQRLGHGLFGLLIAYGGFAFIFPGLLAERVVPQEWPWPAGRKVEALSLQNGEWAVALESAPRVQIYDSGGKYLRGWFVPAKGGSFTIRRQESDATDKPLSGIFVGVSRGNNLVYSLQGALMSEEVRVHGVTPPSQPNGHYEELALPMPWYQWPLVHPAYGWLCAAAGGLGLGALQWLGKKKRGDVTRFLKSGKVWETVADSVSPAARRRVLMIVCIAAYMGLFILVTTSGIFELPGVVTALLFFGPPIFFMIKFNDSRPRSRRADEEHFRKTGNVGGVVEALEKSVEENSDMGASVRLGDMYLRGEGVAADGDKAREHYTRAIRDYSLFLMYQRVGQAATGVAGRLYRSLPRNRDKEEVEARIAAMTKTLEGLAAEGGIWAMRLLHEFHSLRWKPEADNAAAVRYAREIHLRENSSESLVLLGRTLVRENREANPEAVNEGMGYLEEAFAGGNVEAGRVLTMACMSRSAEGPGTNWDRARQFLKRTLSLSASAPGDADGSREAFAYAVGVRLMDERQARNLGHEMTRELYSQMKSFRDGDKGVLFQWRRLAEGY